MLSGIGRELRSSSLFVIAPLLVAHALDRGSMDFRALYDNHVRFVWRALVRAGVPERELPDAVQDVFVVVHRKLPEFEGRSKLTTWLFGICLRVASDRRQLAYSRHEVQSNDLPVSTPADTADATRMIDRRRARAMLEAILDRMPDEQRVAFSLFELDGMTGEEIAELLDVPVGTVRSRLRLARAAFDQAVARLQRRECDGIGNALKASEAK